MAILSASLSTALGKESGKPYSARMDFISTLLSPGSPKTSIISPKGLLACSGQSISLATTF